MGAAYGEWTKEEKKRCRLRTLELVKLGLIEKRLACGDCGGRDRRIQMHHPNYYQPWRVQHLCTRCHHWLHKWEDAHYQAMLWAEP